MNVLQILPELNVGGVETGTVDFAKYLVDHGHQSFVVSIGGELVNHLEKHGTTHFRLPVHKKSLFTVIKMIKRLRVLIKDNNIEIVHARSRIPGWIAYFACRKTSAKFITTCHGYYKNRIFSQVMGWSKLVIVPSQVIARHMVDDFKVPSESIRCIPRSVDLDRFKNITSHKQKDDECIVAVIGRITPIKGHTYFLKAMARVLRTKPYTKIWMIGDAPAKKESYKRELEQLARRLGIGGQVEFLGNRGDVPDLLSRVSVLVFPSIYPESFGRAILEAQAASVPVVATKVGGVLDIIDDRQTGLLVAPKDVESMAKAVLEILNDSILRETLITKAHKKLKEKFTLESMASKTVEVYEELKKQEDILVIKFSSIGDVVLITTSLKALRKRFPNAKIHCFVGKDSRKVLQNCPYLDDLIVFDPDFKDRGWIKLLKCAKKLRRYKFDKIVDFQNNRKSHLLAFLSFPKESYGFGKRKWGFLLTHPLKDYRDDMAPVAHQFQILKMLGIPYKENAYLELWPSEKDKRYVRSILESEWLGNSKNIVGINIAASQKWTTKNWPIEHVAELCDALAGKNVRVIITGLDKDYALAQRLCSITKSKPSIFVGKTDILQLAVLIKHCRVFVTPDSAPMHLAAAMNIPFIALFGPTDSTRHVPPAKKYTILERKLTCAPCYSTRCRIMTHACMNEITAENVAQKVEELMECGK